jgi:raffinose/stachyose/melibiose transport system permease protein
MFSNLSKASKTVIFIVLTVFMVIWAYPIVHAILESFKINGIKNYLTVINHPEVHYFRVLFNSLFIAICTSGIVTALAALAAYAFSKMTFHGQKFLYYSLLACLAIPAAAVMTPMFFTMKVIGLMNTYWAIILPLVAFNAPFMLLVLKNYFDTVPNSLLEAAQIDGSSSLHTFRTILMPLGVPAIVNVSVLTFIYAWNDFLIPLLFVRKESLFTVTLATSYFTSTRNQTPEMVAQLYAALILMTIPSILIYLLSQKYLQDGLTAGAIKN